MDLLTAQLDEYNKHGVPKLADVQLHGDPTISDEGTNPPSLPLHRIPQNRATRSSRSCQASVTTPRVASQMDSTKFERL